MPNDAQFWLQYGSFETSHDRLDWAENFLNQADSLSPGNPYINNALAHLAFRRGIKAASLTEAQGYRESALQRLLTDSGREPSQAGYDFHVLLSQDLIWILRWAPAPEEQAKLLGELKAVAERAKRFLPGDRRIEDAAAEVERNYLMVAVR